MRRADDGERARAVDVGDDAGPDGHTALAGALLGLRERGLEPERVVVFHGTDGDAKLRVCAPLMEPETRLKVTSAARTRIFNGFKCLERPMHTSTNHERDRLQVRRVIQSSVR